MSTKVKFELEFPIQASPQLLYNYISTPSGLSEWFADNVNSRGELFTFIWDDSEEQAKLVTKKSPERIKFKWLESDDDNCYFELRIQVDGITKDVSLIVTRRFETCIQYRCYAFGIFSIYRHDKWHFRVDWRFWRTK